MGDLEQLGVEMPVGFVVEPDGQEAGNEALPERVLPLAAGMLDPQRCGGWDRAATGRPAVLRPG